MLSLAKEFENKPIVFIGVNSGNSREDVAKYARDNKITWPMIVDTSREFEKQARVPKIGFPRDLGSGNLSTTVYVSNGEVVRSIFSPKSVAIRARLRKAKWKINPSKVPEGLEDSWKTCEFGDYDASEAAKRFKSAVMTSLKRDITRFGAIGKRGEHEKAYREFVTIQQRYKGYEIPAKVRKAGQWLKGLPELKEVVKSEAEKTKAHNLAKKKQAEKEHREEKAQDMVDDATSKLFSDRSRNKASGYKLLKRVTLAYPETKAAKQASELLKDVKITTTMRR